MPPLLCYAYTTIISQKGFVVKKIAVKLSADLIFSVRGAIMKVNGQ